MRVVNGRAIEHYKNFDIRESGLAVPRAEPLYRPAISNGYAPNDFIVDSSLVLYLPLYLLKGSKFKSVDRYEHSCDVTGALWRPNGRWFDGINDQINCGTNTSLNITGNITLITFAKVTDATSGQAFISKGDINVSPNTTYGLVVSVFAAEKITFWVRDGATFLTSNSNLVDDTFTHIALTFNPTTDDCNIYLNGVLDKNGAVTGAPGSKPSDPLYIGARVDAAFTSYLTGTIGEVMIYNRVLTAEEITHNYNVTKWRYQ